MYLLNIGKAMNMLSVMKHLGQCNLGYFTQTIPENTVSNNTEIHFHDFVITSKSNSMFMIYFYSTIIVTLMFNTFI